MEGVTRLAFFLAVVDVQWNGLVQNAVLQGDHDGHDWLVDVGRRRVQLCHKQEPRQVFCLHLPHRRACLLVIKLFNFLITFNDTMIAGPIACI